MTARPGVVVITCDAVSIHSFNRSARCPTKFVGDPDQDVNATRRLSHQHDWETRDTADGPADLCPWHKVRR